MTRGRVFYRYEVWYTPDEGMAERLSRFVLSAQRDEILRRARNRLNARPSTAGVIEIHDAHSGATVYRERYLRAPE
jgi:hypothetical protein